MVLEGRCTTTKILLKIFMLAGYSAWRQLQRKSFNLNNLGFLPETTVESGVFDVNKMTKRDNFPTFCQFIAVPHTKKYLFFFSEKWKKLPQKIKILFEFQINRCTETPLWSVYGRKYFVEKLILWASFWEGKKRIFQFTYNTHLSLLALDAYTHTHNGKRFQRVI